MKRIVAGGWRSGGEKGRAPAVLLDADTPRWSGKPNLKRRESSAFLENTIEGTTRKEV